MDCSAVTENAGAGNYAGGELEILALAQRYSAWILDSFGPGLAGDVLEVGAGAGNLTRLIRERPAVRSVTALEPAANLFPLLERACAQLSQVRCLQSTLDGAIESAPHPRQLLGGIRTIAVIVLRKDPGIRRTATGENKSRETKERGKPPQRLLPLRTAAHRGRRDNHKMALGFLSVAAGSPFLDPSESSD